MIVCNFNPPPLIAKPLMVEVEFVALIAVVCIPPANVEVAVEVLVMTPVVSCPIEDDERKELIALNIVAKRLVEVA